MNKSNFNLIIESLSGYAHPDPKYWQQSNEVGNKGIQ